uniref:Sigma-54 factor interaction domain-containing protein n=1 Tax=Ditylenchus dipsaci TaxID=166011 RepID=A0A915DV17_9BILA
MAAIPKDLIETELFGHEKGAFTGANTQHQGRFEQANGGTLFLDEIGDMPFETQTRLLRVLADGEFYRVGGHIPVKVDVRIVAATHQDLEKLVNEGRFREDLYHRLNVIRIHIPKLAHRSEDIPMLAQHFLARADYMQQLPWPGNVRQLENTCRWLTVMITGREVYPEDLPSELKQVPLQKNSDSSQPAPSFERISLHHWDELLNQWAIQSLKNGEMKILDIATPMFERTLINAALQQTRGRKRHAAELLGWGRNTLTRKLKELGMDSADDDEEMSTSPGFTSPCIATELFLEKGYDAVSLDDIVNHAAEFGHCVELYDNAEDAAVNADLIVTDVWASMGQEEEQKLREKAFADFQVNEKLMSLAHPDCLFMHCLPAHRGEEISETCSIIKMQSYGMKQKTVSMLKKL